MRHRSHTLVLPLLLLAAIGCRDRSPRALSGRVTARGQGVVGAVVEVYLEAGRFGTAAPFSSTVSGGEGSFRLNLPPGVYYAVARAEAGGGGRLFAEFPGNPVDLRAGGVADLIFLLEPANSAWEYRGPADSGVTGKVELDGRPAEGCFVYVYRDNRSGLMGPGFLTAEPTEPDGGFRIRLLPGTYWLAARLKSSGGKAGFVEPRDAAATYAGNPVTVAAGTFAETGIINLHPADPGKLSGVNRGRDRKAASSGISGAVLDGDNKPMPGFYVNLYEHPQMIGRPLAVGVTDDRGRFTLNILREGVYYLGARQNRSGPRNPGELAGGYEGTPDHAVKVEVGRWSEGLVVRVEEVW